MFSEKLETLLETALDIGLTEFDFWNMTLAEFDRKLESYKRVQKREAQERAAADYRLADLMGYSMARLYSSSAKYPEIYDVYPAIFDKTAIEEARVKEKSKKTNEWLMNFAASFNKSKS